MRKFFESLRKSVRQSIERDKKLEKPIERISMLIWPWRESKLVFFVSLLALLDYISTYIAIKFNIGHQVYEAGLIAKWALDTGGVREIVFCGCRRHRHIHTDRPRRKLYLQPVGPSGIPACGLYFYTFTVCSVYVWRSDKQYNQYLPVDSKRFHSGVFTAILCL